MAMYCIQYFKLLFKHSFFFGQTKKNLEEGPRKMETERHQTVKNPVVVALQHRAPSHHLHLHPLPLRTTKLSLSHPPRSQVTPYVEGVGRWLLIPSRWRLNLIKVCGFTLIFSLSCRMFISFNSYRIKRHRNLVWHNGGTLPLWFGRTSNFLLFEHFKPYLHVSSQQYTVTGQNKGIGRSRNNHDLRSST